MTNPAEISSCSAAQAKSVLRAIEAIECLMEGTTLSDIALAFVAKTESQTERLAMGQKFVDEMQAAVNLLR